MICHWGYRYGVCVCVCVEDRWSGIGVTSNNDGIQTRAFESWHRKEVYYKGSKGMR